MMKALLGLFGWVYCFYCNKLLHHSKTSVWHEKQSDKVAFVCRGCEWSCKPFLKGMEKLKDADQ